VTPELANIRKELRFLRAYAFSATALFSIIWFSGSLQEEKRPHFAEIDVERINIVEADGQLRMVISNRARQHPGSVDGKLMERPDGRPPGMLFFNQFGDECGGLIFDESGPGSKGHFVQMSFDKTRNDQSVAVRHLEGEDGDYYAGLSVWDRPNSSLAWRDSVMEVIEAMPDKDSRKEAFARLRDAGEFGSTRMLVGRFRDKSSSIMMCDTKGNPRLWMRVDSLGIPKLEFMDEKGKVIYSVPS